MNKEPQTGKTKFEVKNNMRKRRRPGLQKEKIIMLTASLFVLTALTMTGVYVKEKNKSDNDEYVVDLSAIEKQVQNKAEEIGKTKEDTKTENEQAMADDLDADPEYQEANSGSVKNTLNPQTEGTIQIPGVGYAKVDSQKNAEDMMENTEEEQDTEKEIMDDEANADDSQEVQATSAGTNSTKKASYTFSEADTLQWPIVGNVLINYSMDKTVYFASLNQYKYNPAIVIEATVGEPITAAASGEISAIREDAETGNTVAMNIGGGYEVTYGQLDNIQVGTGQNVQAGDIIGYVAEPTKYYSVEGSNVYFKLTKDGATVNPMSRLE